jgi:NAD(P)-dependent dehydrogenase (short-subunit alcohol dehydrogenase family)
VEGASSDRPEEDPMPETQQRDPRSGPTPPFPQQEQQVPGEDRLTPRADHGEESYRGSGKLADLATIVTGGDSGIGRAVAIAFAREGADVLVSYLEAEEADARETARHVEEAGRRAELVAGDIGDPAHCRAVVERAIGAFGRLDVLVNNAATQTTHDSFLEIDDATVEKVFRTNVFSLFALCRAAVPHLGPGGAIVNTTSIQAFDPSPQLLHYAATKAAIVAFTKGLSQELIESGVRVNAVAPGPVWTPLIAATMEPDKVAEFGETNPTGRPAQPAELAPAYVFLASADSRFITGEVIGVTGGRLLPS